MIIQLNYLCLFAQRSLWRVKQIVVEARPNDDNRETRPTAT